MKERFSRTASLVGNDAIERLKRSTVAVFGLGGVGGYALEALARAGVGTIYLIDGDKVAPSNLNRQILATISTVGQNKVDVAEQRIKDINPDVKVVKRAQFYMPETQGDYDFSQFDYVIDAVDMVTAKLLLAVNCQNLGVPIISCMGTGNKLDCTAFEVADIYETSVCPLARVMRNELKKRGVKNLKVVYSKEVPQKPIDSIDGVRSAPASISYVPSVAGLIMAGEVIKSLIEG